MHYEHCQAAVTSLSIVPKKSRNESLTVRFFKIYVTLEPYYKLEHYTK